MYNFSFKLIFFIFQCLVQFAFYYLIIINQNKQKFLYAYYLLQEQNKEMFSPKNFDFLRVIKESIPFRSWNNKSTVESQEQSLKTSSSFYHTFISNQKFISASIGDVFKQNCEGFRINCYAVYEISILTEDITYMTRKRYSEFKKLYDEVSKITTVKTSFPKKTIIYQGTDDEIVEIRKKKLNCKQKSIIEFLLELKFLSKQSTIGLLFFNFLAVKQNYNFKHFNICDNYSEELFTSSSQYINLQIINLNSEYGSAISTFAKIDKLFFQKKPKIEMLSLRILFTGTESKKGIIEFSLKNANILITIEGLKLIEKLINPQKNIQSERFKKVFQSISSKKLMINDQSRLQQSNFTEIFCKIVYLYLEDKNSKQQIIEEIFNNEIDIYLSYVARIQSQTLSRFSRTLKHSQSSQSILSIKIDSQYQKQYNESNIFEEIITSSQKSILKQLQNCSILRQELLSDKQYVFVIKSSQENIFRMQIVKKGDYKEICKKIESMEWNDLLIGEKFSNQHLVNCRIVAETKQKSIKLKRQVQKKQKYWRQILSPFSLILGSICLYQLCEIQQIEQGIVKVNIVYYFIGSMTKNALKSKVFSEKTVCNLIRMFSKN